MSIMQERSKAMQNRSFASSKSFGSRGRGDASGSGKIRSSFAGSRLFGRKTGFRSRQASSANDRAHQGFMYSDPIFQKGYDPLRLLEGLKPMVSSIIQIKKGGIKALGAAWDRYYAQLRGTTVVLMDTEYADFGGSAGHPAYLGLFTLVGCEMVVKVPGEQIALKRPGNLTTVNLRFESVEAFSQWKPFLELATRQRKVGLNDFEIIHAIGKGASGKVFLVRDKSTGEKLALKSIDKTSLYKSRSAYRHAVDERLMLELSIGQPFFIQLKYAFQTYQKIYFVTDFCQGGDLFYFLRTHGGCLKEAEARRLAAETVVALEFMHSQGFVYRDLKPENVLLDTDGHLKLADFGLCKRLDPAKDNGMTSTICGTHTYAAPEMLVVRQYGQSIDLWTLGVFVYHTLRGRTPYDARDIDTVVQRMNNDPIRFPRDASLELINLVTSLLERKPENRLGCGPLGISELRKHAFFRDVDWKGVQEKQQHTDNLKITTNPVQAPGGVPNFDLSEWKDVAFDAEDYMDDGRCDESSLWPLQKAGRNDIMDFFVVGYSFNIEYARECKRLMANANRMEM